MKARRHASAAGARCVVNAMFPEAPARKHAATRAFDLERFDHPMYVAAYRKAMRLIRAGQPERLIVIAGPTGAGKTTLSKSIYEQLCQDAVVAGGDPSTIPCTLVRSVTNSGPFDWKDLYIRLLEELYEPNPEQQLLLPELRETLLMNGAKMQGENFDLLALRRRLEKAVRKRRTSVIIIDEAHHILIGGRSDQLELQFETIKSFAQMTGATIVLVGIYELLAIRDLSSQLVRRSETVHLGRYDSNDPNEAAGFAEFIEMALKKLPVPLERKLHGPEGVNYFYKSSIGTPGIARDLMACALDEALDSRSHAITLDLLRQHVKAPEALETLLAAAIDGELRMNRSSEERIIQLLTLPKEDAAKALRAHAAANGCVAGAVPPTSHTRALSLSSGQYGRVRRGIGKRLPVRDPVGRQGLP